MRRLGHVGGMGAGGFEVEFHADAGALRHREARPVKLKAAFEDIRQQRTRRKDLRAMARAQY